MAMSAEECRTEAVRLRKNAALASPGARGELLRMATVWDDLARAAERLTAADIRRPRSN